MKTTVDLPDDLMTEVKVLAARERRKLREVMEELLTAGLRARAGPQAPPVQVAEEAAVWLSGWRDLGDRVEAASVDPRSCVDIVLGDRR